VTDPYDLIRDALPIMRQLAKAGDAGAKAWMRAYKKLPGVGLTKEQVRVLRFKDLRPHDEAATAILRERGYLEGHEKRVGPYSNRRNETVWRRSERGREALRLRNEP